MAKSVTAAHFKPAPQSVSDMLAKDGWLAWLPEYHICTQHTIYKANTLHGALTLWRQSGDSDEVINVVRVG